MESPCEGKKMKEVSRQKVGKHRKYTILHNSLQCKKYRDGTHHL